MPTLRPRKRASASSSSAFKSSPATVTDAGVGALQPGHHHQQRRFARAGRSDQANRLAAAYIEVDVFENMDAGRAVPERKIDAGKRNGRPAAWDGAFMGFYRSRPRTYGAKPARVQCFAALLLAAAVFAPAAAPGPPTSGR